MGFVLPEFFSDETEGEVVKSVLDAVSCCLNKLNPQRSKPDPAITDPE